MKGIAVTGLQNGDEGKGKAVHYLGTLAPQPLVVERFQGGGNAGHTMVIDGESYKLHHLPSGIIIAHAFSLLGEGMFINPRKVTREIRTLQEKGVPISQKNLGIAATAHLTLDYHVAADQESFQREQHTSTGNGIKQTAVDKYGRVGIRFIEFLDQQLMEECLKRRFPQGMPESYGNFEKFAASYDAEREFLQPFLVQQHEARRKHDYWLGEGAQGFLLDVDAGQYPGITSSHPAQVPQVADTILGVVKLYTSSVGTGDRPFVSRMTTELESRLREPWKEFGTTTGKKRELGWFDAVAVKYAVESTGTDYLVGTCGDRLQELATENEPVRIVTGYKIGTKTYPEWDLSFHRRDVLRHAEPVCEEFKPWLHFTEADGRTLNSNAQRYIDRIQKLTGKEFIMLGTGEEHREMIMSRNPWEIITPHSSNGR